jgi:hypothetical protein
VKLALFHAGFVIEGAALGHHVAPPGERTVLTLRPPLSFQPGGRRLACFTRDRGRSCASQDP